MLFTVIPSSGLGKASYQPLRSPKFEQWSCCDPRSQSSTWCMNLKFHGWLPHSYLDTPTGGFLGPGPRPCSNWRHLLRPMSSSSCRIWCQALKGHRLNGISTALISNAEVTIAFPGLTKLRIFWVWSLLIPAVAAFAHQSVRLKASSCAGSIFVLDKPSSLPKRVSRFWRIPAACSEGDCPVSSFSCSCSISMHFTFWLLYVYLNPYCAHAPTSDYCLQRWARVKIVEDVVAHALALGGLSDGVPLHLWEEFKEKALWKHWTTLFFLAESIISPCCQVVGPLCQYLAEHEVFQEATRGENRTDADGQTRECVSASKMSFSHVSYASSLKWWLVALTRENNHSQGKTITD